MKNYLKYILGTVVALAFAYPIAASALSTYLTVQGGTGTSSPSGILYGDNSATNHLNTTIIGSGLTFVGGLLSAATSGSGSGLWTRVNNSGVRPATSTDQVLIGSTATTSIAKLDVEDNAYISGSLGIGSGATTQSSVFQISTTTTQGTPSTSGSIIRVDGTTFTDTATAGSGTAANFAATSFARPTLGSTNSPVTTTNAGNVTIAGGVIAGANETLANSFGLRITTNSVAGAGTVTNAYGATIAAPTGATNNYAFTTSGGNNGLGTQAPTAWVQVAAGTQLIPSWTTVGNVIAVNANTATDNSTAAGSTIANRVATSFNRPIVGFNIGTSTITDGATVYIAGAMRGDNASSTFFANSSALYIDGGSVTNSGATQNSYGLTANASNGAAFNYTAIFNGGFVGIGTTTPGSLLDMNGNVAVGGTSTTTLTIQGRLNSNSWTVGTAIAEIDFKNNDASGANSSQIRSYISTVTENTSGTAWAQTFGTAANNDTPVERVRISSTGSLGVGTTSPAQLLSIGGNVIIGASTAGGTNGTLTYGGVTAANTVTGTGSLVLSAGPTLSGTVTIPLIRGGGNANSTLTIGGGSGVVTTASIIFGASTGSEIMRLNARGLGIGTSTPAWILTVATSSTGTLFNNAQLALVDTDSTPYLPWLFSVEHGLLTIGTSTATGATSTPAAITVTNAGQLSTTELIFATSSNMTVDWNNTPNQVDIRIGSAGVTIGFNNASTSGMTKRIYVCNPGGTAGAVTWIGPEWFGGTTPTQTTTANQCDLWSFNTTLGTSTVKVFGALSAGAQ